MNKNFRRVLSCLLSLLLIAGSCLATFAAAKTETTPVVVINDIDSNPLRDLSDGSEVFNFTDYEYDILFTSGFSAEITDLFSKEVLDSITSGEVSTSDIITMLIDYLGFSGDINTIINKVLELMLSIFGSEDFENIDIQSIIGAINFNQFADNIKKQIKDAMADILAIRLDKNGKSVNPDIGAVVYPESLEYYRDDDYSFARDLAGDIGDAVAQKIGEENTYIFTYDWRLDPLETAAILDEFIENVKSETGADKVSVISEGYGSTVAVAYLSEYADNAAENVKNFVTVSSEFLGTSLVGDFFKGDIVSLATNNTSYTSAYIRYTNDISDNPITAFTTWMTNYIFNRDGGLRYFTLYIERILSEFEDALKDAGVTDAFASMPGIWALVPVSDFDAAAKNIFGKNTDTAL